MILRPLLHRLRTLQRRRTDSGFAMLTVVASMFVLSIIVLGATYTAVSAIPISRHSQDFEAAMAAAKAGVDDYLQRLSADTLYWKVDNTDPTNLALVDPSRPATANDWRTVPGVPIPASDAPDPAPKSDVPQYQYQVLQTFSEIRSFGLITLKVTGKSQNVHRTVLVDLRQESFLRYAYYTDKETFDALLYPLAGQPAANGAKCAAHYHYSTASDPESRAHLTATGVPCLDPAFNSSDVVNGPLHTNDAMLLRGTPTFKSAQTESSWPSSGVAPLPAPNHLWWTVAADPAASPKSGGYRPVYANRISLPPANTQLSDAADPAKGGKGCLYTGPTRITFVTGGGYKVISPDTTSAPSYCGTFPYGNREQTVVGPPNGVVYVRAVGAGHPVNGFWPNFPSPADDTANDPVFGYDQRAGEAFVQGRVSGRYTVGSDNNITIMGDLIYQGGSTGRDVLGLISENGFVQIYHPVHCAQPAKPPTCDTNVPSEWVNVQSPTNIEVDAAIMSVMHSFIVQNYDRGPQVGTLTVLGAIDQEYRGPVSTLNSTNTPLSGYAKNYVYDTRLQNFPPPAYINPVNARWQIQQFSEQ